MVAISTDDLATAQMTKERLGLSFAVIPDSDKQIINTFGLLHPDEGIAMPSVFIIDEKGEVRWRYIGRDAADRPGTLLLINVLKWL